MLEVKVDIIPFGIESQRKTLGMLFIGNTGRHPQRPERGEYIVTHDGGNFVIEDFERDRGFWALVQKALNRYLVSEE